MGDQRPHHLLLLWLEDNRTEERLAALEAEREELRAEARHLATDTLALEALARQKGMIRPGDLVYRIVPVPPDVHQAAAESLTARAARIAADSLAAAREAEAAAREADRRRRRAREPGPYPRPPPASGPTGAASDPIPTAPSDGRALEPDRSEPGPADREPADRVPADREPADRSPDLEADGPTGPDPSDASPEPESGGARQAPSSPVSPPPSVR